MVRGLFDGDAGSMAMLAMLKLQYAEQFSTMFTGYDLLARRLVSYAYPWLEALAAVLMAGHCLPWLSIPVALFIGSGGAASLFYAVYVQKREIKCACVGADRMFHSASFRSVRTLG